MVKGVKSFNFKSEPPKGAKLASYVLEDQHIAEEIEVEAPDFNDITKGQRHEGLNDKLYSSTRNDGFKGALLEGYPNFCFFGSIE